MGKKSITKGKAYERQLARLFAARMPGATVQRGLRQTRDGSECPDVDAPGLWIEAKRGKRPSVRAALAQADEANKGGRLTVAVVRDDRQPAFVAMPLDDFLELIEQWWVGRAKA